MAINFVAVSVLLSAIFADHEGIYYDPYLISLLRELSKGAGESKNGLLAIQKMNANLVKREFSLALSMLEEIPQRNLDVTQLQSKTERLIELFQVSYHGFEGLPFFKQYEAEAAAYAGILLAMLQAKDPAIDWINRAIASYTVIANTTYTPEKVWFRPAMRNSAKRDKFLREVNAKQKPSVWDYARWVGYTYDQSLQRNATRLWPDFNGLKSVWEAKTLRDLLAKPDETPRSTWIDGLLTSAHWAYAKATDSLTPEQLDQRNMQLVAQKTAEAKTAIIELERLKSKLV